MQRPRIRETILRDIAIMEHLSHLLARHIPESRRYDPVGLVEEFRKTILRRLDDRREGRRTDRLRHNLREITGISLPRVLWEYSTPRVLTIEYVIGQGLREVISKSPDDRHRIATALYKLPSSRFSRTGFPMGIRIPAIFGF